MAHIKGCYTALLLLLLLLQLHCGKKQKKNNALMHPLGKYWKFYIVYQKLTFCTYVMPGKKKILGETSCFFLLPLPWENFPHQTLERGKGGILRCQAACSNLVGLIPLPPLPSARAAGQEQKMGKKSKPGVFPSSNMGDPFPPDMTGGEKRDSFRMQNIPSFKKRNLREKRAQEKKNHKFSSPTSIVSSDWIMEKKSHIITQAGDRFPLVRAIQPKNINKF